MRRGPHTFFLRQGKVQRWPGYLVNLIHYEDAARLCLAVSACILMATVSFSLHSDPSARMHCHYRLALHHG